MDELIARCDLCKEPLDSALLSVEIWKWVLHPRCAVVVRERLDRFIPVIFDMSDQEFEAWCDDAQPGEWRRGGGDSLEYEADSETRID